MECKPNSDRFAKCMYGITLAVCFVSKETLSRFAFVNIADLVVITMWMSVHYDLLMSYICSVVFVSPSGATDHG